MAMGRRELEAQGDLWIALSSDSSVTPVTHWEALTHEFYAWERRGRGWQAWNRPVPLEPPFRPFLYHAGIPRGLVPDDGRKPSWLDRIVAGFRGYLKGQSNPDLHEALPEQEEPDAEEFVDDGALVELRVAVPPTLKIPSETAEQLLLSLSAMRYPLSFEVIASADSIQFQWVCRQSDRPVLEEQLRAHFPVAAVTEQTGFLGERWTPSAGRPVAAVEFGLANEFMRPLKTFRSFDADPWVSVIGALSPLDLHELGLVQVLFQPTRGPWAASMLRAVTDGQGDSFFADAPEMLPLTREKVSRPLFAVALRVMAASDRSDRARHLAALFAGALLQWANPPSNELIPLETADEHDSDLVPDLLARRSRRAGMILNSEELVGFVHLPSASVRSEKLVRQAKKTRAAPAGVTGQQLVLGDNVHAGKTTAVTLRPDQRVRHTHVVGASGTGKSTFLLNLIIQDIEHGEGVGVLDPHGDLIDRVLEHVPESRFDDVVLFDSSDEDYPIGVNLLSAHSPLEKNLLASDLVAVFQRLSTSWGDQMTSVLGNAIQAFLESTVGGTLADLRRFLVEAEFRRNFLQTVQDEEVVYYWLKEFPLLSGRPQAPLLTRLDAFLRPRLIRRIVCQQHSPFDFSRLMNDGKIFLAKLSQGAIGEENAYLLGSLLVTKFHQLALGRQELAEAERRPFMLYLDEFHHFLTPSLTALLSGARKYRLGLVLAHQELRQLGTRDAEVLQAVLTNPATRVCFRVGDDDAKRLAENVRDLEKIEVHIAEYLKTLNRDNSVPVQYYLTSYETIGIPTEFLMGTSIDTQISVLYDRFQIAYERAQRLADIIARKSTEFAYLFAKKIRLLEASEITQKEYMQYLQEYARKLRDKPVPPYEPIRPVPEEPPWPVVAIQVQSVGLKPAASYPQRPSLDIHGTITGGHFDEIVYEYTISGTDGPKKVTERLRLSQPSDEAPTPFNLVAQSRLPDGLVTPDGRTLGWLVPHGRLLLVGGGSNIVTYELASSDHIIRSPHGPARPTRRSPRP